LLRDGQRALHIEGNLLASRRLFDAAFRSAERERDPQAMAVAAIGLGGLWVQEHRTVAGAALVQARQRRALAQLDPDSTLARQLRTRLAAEADYRTDSHGGILAAVEETRAARDPLAWTAALSLAHHCILGPEHGSLRRDLAQELVDEAHRTGRRSDMLMGLLWRTADLLLDADRHAERSLRELKGLLEHEDHLAVGFVVKAIEVMREIRSGNLGVAEELANECAQLGATAGDADSAGWYGAQLVAIRWYQGRVGEMVGSLAEMAHSPTLSAVDNSFFAGLAVAAAQAGDRRQAAGALARLGGRDLAALPRSSSWLVLMYGVIEAAHLLGDGETAAQAYALLRPYARLPIMASLGIVCFGSAHHPLGIAALTVGDPAAAVEHLRLAVAGNLGLGHWPAATLSRFWLAQALLATGRPDDLEVAELELAAAAQEASGLGMTLPARTPAYDWQAGEPAAGDAPAPGAAGGAPPGPAGLATCRRRGRQWRIDLDGRTAMVEHSVGLHYLAVLLANPNQEISAVDLAAGPGFALPVGTEQLPIAGGESAARTGEEAGERSEAARRGNRVPGGSRRGSAYITGADIGSVAPAGAAATAQPVLDEVARREYRQRLARIPALIEECEARGDNLQATALRAERDWLVAELAAATGLGGRPRQFTDGAERARIAVGKAIRRALQRVSAVDPVIGAELRATVQTGIRCSYRPTIAE
jgi:hypothetical protein